MKTTSDEEKRRAFQALHNPDRPICQIANAQRTNSAEKYDSAKVRATGKRLLDGSVRVARGVLLKFAEQGKPK